MEKDKDLEKIKRIQKEVILVKQAAGLLGWDQMTYMPEKASDSRSEQMTILNSFVHDKLTSDELMKPLERLHKNIENLDEEDKFMVSKLHHDVTRERKLPAEFVEKLSKVSSKGFNLWKKAREKEDFEIFKPILKQIVDMTSSTP